MTPDYRRLFESVPGCYVVLTPDLVIVAASDAYLAVTMTRREAIVDRPLFEAFPGNPDAPASTAEADLRASISRVVATRRPDVMPTHTYAIRRGGADGGAFEERHWSPMNVPVFGDDGRVALVIHGVEDVTEQVRGRQRVREMSTPVVRVRERVLLLPLIGDVDSERAGQIMRTVLDRVIDETARVLILDVAGVQVMDTSVADALVKVARAVALLGAETVLTGIGPSAAKTMVNLGVDLSTLHTCSRLSEGVDLALRLIEGGVRGALPRTSAALG